MDLRAPGVDDDEETNKAKNATFDFSYKGKLVKVKKYLEGNLKA